MTIRRQLNQTWILMLSAFCVQGQTLMQAPLGDVKAPVMSLYVLRLDPGRPSRSHSHDRAIFAYVLEGEIENQIESNPLKILRPGDFFNERPNQVHSLFRNLSETKPAKLLMFQNRPMLSAGATLPSEVEPKPLLQELLNDIPNAEVSLTKITTPPGGASTGAHQHPGPVFGYLLKGEVESQVDPDPPKIYHAGDVFYEAPMHAHRSYRNLSQTEPAELLVFQVRDKDKPFSIRMPDIAQQPPQALPPVPPGMMPYVAILEPQFVPAWQAGFLQDEDILIGVARGNVAKAFPASDLAQHGSVNDQMPDEPIEVTWCGTCNTGVVFRARFKGRTLHFDYDSMVSGNEVHKDRETGSRWQQSTGEAISGPLKGSHLELYPFVRTTWKEWRRRYPNTVVLKPLPGYAERMAGLGKRQRAITLSNVGAAPAAAFGHDDRLRPKETVAGLQIGSDMKAFPFSELRIARVVNDRVGGVPILVVHQPSSDTTTAFEARAKGKVLQFQAVDADASSLIDLETHSSWNAYGLCLEGLLKGTQLKALILMSEFWFAWSEFHPQTKLFTTK